MPWLTSPKVTSPLYQSQTCSSEKRGHQEEERGQLSTFFLSRPRPALLSSWGKPKASHICHSHHSVIPPPRPSLPPYGTNIFLFPTTKASSGRWRGLRFVSSSWYDCSGDAAAYKKRFGWGSEEQSPPVVSPPPCLQETYHSPVPSKVTFVTYYPSPSLHFTPLPAPHLHHTRAGCRELAMIAYRQ